MPRVSRREADANRMRVVKTAATMYREGGIERVSVVEVMKSAGMTAGAFHAQFGSKEALATEACNYAFAEGVLSLKQVIHEKGTSVEVLLKLMQDYLSIDHRDNPGAGCPAAALANDVVHEAKSEGLRQAYLEGIKQVADTLTGFLPDSVSKKKRLQRALALYSALVGAITMARATSQDPISEAFLAAAIEATKELANM